MANGNGGKLNGWAQFVLTLVLILVTIVVTFTEVRSKAATNTQAIQTLKVETQAADNALEGRLTSRLDRIENKLDRLLERGQ